jgi:hypothetical protein
MPRPHSELAARQRDEPAGVVRDRGATVDSGQNTARLGLVAVARAMRSALQPRPANLKHGPHEPREPRRQPHEVRDGSVQLVTLQHNVRDPTYAHTSRKRHRSVRDELEVSGGDCDLLFVTPRATAQPVRLLCRLRGGNRCVRRLRGTSEVRAGGGFDGGPRLGLKSRPGALFSASGRARRCRVLTQSDRSNDRQSVENLHTACGPHPSRRRCHSAPLDLQSSGEALRAGLDLDVQPQSGRSGAFQRASTLRDGRHEVVLARANRWHVVPESHAGLRPQGRDGETGH